MLISAAGRVYDRAFVCPGTGELSDMFWAAGERGNCQICFGLPVNVETVGYVLTCR